MSIDYRTQKEIEFDFKDGIHNIEMQIDDRLSLLITCEENYPDYEIMQIMLLISVDDIFENNVTETILHYEEMKVEMVDKIATHVHDYLIKLHEGDDDFHVYEKSKIYFDEKHIF